MDGQGFGPCMGCPDGGRSSGGTDGGSSSGASSGASSGSSSGTTGGSSSGGSGSGGMSAGSYDGTIGRPCSTNADCVADGGPGKNKCSATLGFQIGSNSTIDPYPSPVCVVPTKGGTSCDPAPASDPSGQFIHFCDGPDNPTSPGLCVPLTSPATSGLGTCLPVCFLALDGSAPTGCVGTDTCVENTVVLATGGPPFGIGYCQGTCTADADCTGLGSGFVCQTNYGDCTTSHFNPTKALGTACTAADTANGACNCLTFSSTTGYCSSACVIGGPDCPNGWVCDSLQPAVVPDGTGGGYSVPAPSMGAAGMCVIPCTTDDAGNPTCPGSLTCVSGTASGPDCLP